jgi:hypothetical protein
MNFFPHNDPYYHLPKYLPFLLNHPVYTHARAHAQTSWIWMATEVTLSCTPFEILYTSHLISLDDKLISSAFDTTSLNNLYTRRMYIRCPTWLDINVRNAVVQKRKILPVQDMRPHTDRRGTAPLILNLGNEWRRAITLTPRLLYPRERTPVPIE